MFGLALSVFLFVLCQSTEAQQLKKVHRLGYLSAYDLASESSQAEGIRLALLKMGYMEGENIITEYRYAEGKRQRYPELAAELVRLKVDAIVLAGGLLPIQAAMQATNTIPIVMTGSGADPVKTGVVVSLARPGGNVTGITNLVTDLSGKRLELLKECAPKISRVAVFYDPDVPAGRQMRDDLPIAGRGMGLSVLPWAIRAKEDLDKVFEALSKEHPDGLYASSGLVINANGNRIADFALKRRLPSTFTEIKAVHAGGLMYYGADLSDSYRRVARYVDRILRGAKPADLPVEQPSKFELAVNLKTTQQLGLTIPQAILARADRVIR